MDQASGAREEYLTIIAPTAEEVMAQFRARGLASQGYLIAGRMGRHHFSLVGEARSTELFSGDEMAAATFVRRVG